MSRRVLEHGERPALVPRAAKIAFGRWLTVLPLLWSMLRLLPTHAAIPSYIIIDKVPTGTIVLDGDPTDIWIHGSFVLPQTINFFNAGGRFGEFNDADYDLAMAYDNTGIYFGLLVTRDLRSSGGLNNNDDPVLKNPFLSDALSVYLDPLWMRGNAPRSYHVNFVMVAGSTRPHNGIPIPLAGHSWLRVGTGRPKFEGFGHRAGWVDGDPRFVLGDENYAYEGFISFEELRRHTGLPIPVPGNGTSWGMDFQFIDSEADQPRLGQNGRIQVWAPANLTSNISRSQLDEIASRPANWGRAIFSDDINDPPPARFPEPPIVPWIYYHGDVAPDAAGWWLMRGAGNQWGRWQILTEGATNFCRVTDLNERGQETMIFGHHWWPLAERGSTVVARMRLREGLIFNSSDTGNASLVGYDELDRGAALSFRSGSQVALTGGGLDNIVRFPLNLEQWHIYWMVMYPEGSSPQTALYIQDVTTELAAWQFQRAPDLGASIRGLPAPALAFGSASPQGTVQVDIDWLAVLPYAAVFDGRVGGFRHIQLPPLPIPPSGVGGRWRLYP